MRLPPTCVVCVFYPRHNHFEHEASPHLCSLCILPCHNHFEHEASPHLCILPPIIHQASSPPPSPMPAKSCWSVWSARLHRWAPTGTQAGIHPVMLSHGNESSPIFHWWILSGGSWAVDPERWIQVVGWQWTESAAVLAFSHRQLKLVCGKSELQLCSCYRWDSLLLVQFLCIP